MPEEAEESAPTLPREALHHLDALYRLACHLTRNAHEAEDLVQEAYARAYGSHSQFTRGTNLRAWLFRILRNLYIDSFRRDGKSPVRGGLDDDDVASTTPEPLRGDEELERMRGIVAEDIEAALRSLSVDARTIVLLDLEGLTESELAEVLSCSVGTVKSRLSRARATLRERLRDYAR